MKKRLYSVLLVGLVLLLATLNIGCPTANVDAIEDFITVTDAAMNEAINIAEGVNYIYTNSQRLSNATIVRECNKYVNEYYNLINTYSAHSFPKQCSLLRGFTIEAFTYSIEELNEFVEAFSTGDYYHMQQAELYYQYSQDAAYAAAVEYDKIVNKYLD